MNKDNFRAYVTIDDKKFIEISLYDGQIIKIVQAPDKLYMDHFDQVLEYEIKGSFLGSLIFWNWGQNLFLKYIVWKTKIKIKRKNRVDDFITKTV